MRWLQSARNWWSKAADRVFGGKGGKGGRSGESRGPEQVWDPARTVKALAILVCTAAGLLLALSWGTLEERLGEYAARHRPAAVDERAVVLLDAPAWMPPVLQRQVQRTVADELTVDPFDRAALERALAALRANPWVEQARQVQRHHDRVLVTADYRRPVAGVESCEGYRLVDGKGVVLPGVYRREHLGHLGLPALVGVPERPPVEGRRWESRGLEAGLSLVRHLWEQPIIREVSVFDVSGQAYDARLRAAAGQPRLALWTRHGLVRWGLAPGREGAIEPPAATKSQWLANLKRRHGSIDAGGRAVDVYGPAVLIHDTTETPGQDQRYTLRQ